MKRTQWITLPRGAPKSDGVGGKLRKEQIILNYDRSRIRNRLLRLNT